MSPIIVSTFGAFTALLLVFAFSEMLAKVTKGGVQSVLVIMILMLVGVSTGLFPKTIIDDAGVSDALFKVACGLLVTHLGTLKPKRDGGAVEDGHNLARQGDVGAEIQLRGLRGFDGLRDIHLSRREPRGERIFQARDRRERDGTSRIYR